MSFRTVVIESRSKLDLRDGYIEIRDDMRRCRVFLDEISVLIIENPACTVTCCLLNALIEKKIKVMFCNRQHLPHAELFPVAGSADFAGKLREQIAWRENITECIWTHIIQEKIRQQAKFLRNLNKTAEADKLDRYAEQVLFGDPENKEGISARLYFCTLFGSSFTRNDDTPLNSALNYGYIVLTSAFSREISACGYSTALGFCHRSRINSLNLSCDLLEPFRIAVDRYVYAANYPQFGTDEKHHLVKFLETEVQINGSRQFLSNAIRIYLYSVFTAVRENDPEQIKFYTV